MENNALKRSIVMNAPADFTYTRIKIPAEMEKQVFESFLGTLLDEIKRLSEEK